MGKNRSPRPSFGLVSIGIVFLIITLALFYLLIHLGRFSWNWAHRSSIDLLASAIATIIIVEFVIQKALDQARARNVKHVIDRAKGIGIRRSDELSGIISACFSDDIARRRFWRGKRSLGLLDYTFDVKVFPSNVRQICEKLNESKIELTELINHLHIHDAVLEYPQLEEFRDKLSKDVDKVRQFVQSSGLLDPAKAAFVLQTADTCRVALRKLPAPLSKKESIEVLPQDVPTRLISGSIHKRGKESARVVPA